MGLHKSLGHPIYVFSQIPIKNKRTCTSIRDTRVRLLTSKILKKTFFLTSLLYTYNNKRYNNEYNPHDLSHIPDRTVHIFWWQHLNSFFCFSRIGIAMFVYGRHSEFIFSAFHKALCIKRVAVGFTTSHPAAAVQFKSFNLLNIKYIKFRAFHLVMHFFFSWNSHRKLADFSLNR